MKYVGLQTQIWRNNTRSTLLLVAFPLLLLTLTWLFFFFIGNDQEDQLAFANDGFISIGPFILIGVAIWFVVAWFSYDSMIQAATGSRPLERKENKRVYNILENLCISRGLTMPKLFIIEDDSLNAFASGLSDKSASISLSRGIIDKLNDEELEAVMAHELTHIRNRDVRLLVISIIFVGIFAFLAEMAMRSLRHVGRGKKDKSGYIVLLILALALVGYLLSALFKFALSRKREYLADAGSAELTKNPLALASALKKVAEDPRIEAVTRHDVAQMFLENPGEKQEEGFFSAITGLFATHPPIEDRIKVLEQY